MKFTSSQELRQRVQGPRYEGQYCVAEPRIEILLVRTIRLGGLPIWRWIVDREEMPIWAFCSQSCTGSTEWKTRLVA